jgi:aminopeptidase N
MKYVDKDLFVDYRGKKVNFVSVNGIKVKSDTESFKCFIDHKIYLPKELLKVGHNIVTISFISEYVRDC